MSGLVPNDGAAVTRQQFPGAVNSESDEERFEYLIALPKTTATAVVIAFHPWGLDPESILYGEKPGRRLIRHLPGLLGPATRLGIAVVAPYARGRVLDAVSLGWAAHINNAVRVAGELASDLNSVPVGALGLSQGGMDALLSAGRHPDTVRAVVAVNPIVDLAAFYDDIESLPVPHMKDRGALEEIVREVGGPPDQVREEYDLRSPTHFIQQLARVPIGLVWSPDDGIVARSEERQAGRLARDLRRAEGDVLERRTSDRGPDPSMEWRHSHESFDSWSALGLLLELIDMKDQTR